MILGFFHAFAGSHPRAIRAFALPKSAKRAFLCNLFGVIAQLVERDLTPATGHIVVRVCR
ncbi:MAG: hypothetical protein RIQ71_2587 [Verrucomicrobiota bacterium]|jgi:hypothetical protein